MGYAKSWLIAACAAALLVSMAACASHPTPPASAPLAESIRANALSTMHGEALRVLVRQLADCTGRLHQGGFVIEVSQCQWRSPH
jgi:curli biogenesis system outer membrane secretion channel CsgG